VTSVDMTRTAAGAVEPDRFSTVRVPCENRSTIGLEAPFPVLQTSTYYNEVFFK
jgi:hypothetical protein